MRRVSLVIVTAVLVLGLPHRALAQSPDTQSAQTGAKQLLPAVVPQTGSQSVGTDCCASPTGQPTSLGEIARLARAKKDSQPKATKIFNDENMPRAPMRTGEKAPEIGGDVASAGKVTLLDFWASWCGPCREALPGLKQLEAAYRGEGFEVVSVSEDEDEGAWRQFVTRHQMNWTQRLDSGHQMARQFGASALPTYILIGKDGTVVQQYVGHSPSESVADRIGPDLKRSLEGS